MELWIRSQDELELIKVIELYIFESEFDEHHFEIKGIADNSGSDVLGTYKTKKRALEVLDEIQDELISTNYIPLEDNMKITCGSARFYKMPQE